MASKGATLELAVLGLLHDSPLHGYELRKRLNLLLGWTRLLSYGSLYPALKRMLRAGLVTEVATASPGVSRRQRIVYQITPAGSEYFAGKITDVGPSAWEDEDFNMRFAFFSRTDSEVRLRILEGRRSPSPGAARPGPHQPGTRGRRPLRQRAAAPLHRVGRARGPLADRPDRGRACRTRTPCRRRRTTARPADRRTRQGRPQPAKSAEPQRRTQPETSAPSTRA